MTENSQSCCPASSPVLSRAGGARHILASQALRSHVGPSFLTCLSL